MGFLEFLRVPERVSEFPVVFWGEQLEFVNDSGPIPQRGCAVRLPRDEAMDAADGVPQWLTLQWLYLHV